MNRNVEKIVNQFMQGLKVWSALPENEKQSVISILKNRIQEDLMQSGENEGVWSDTYRILRRVEDDVDRKMEEVDKITASSETDETESARQELHDLYNEARNMVLDDIKEVSSLNSPSSKSHDTGAEKHVLKALDVILAGLKEIESKRSDR